MIRRPAAITAPDARSRLAGIGRLAGVTTSALVLSACATTTGSGGPGIDSANDHRWEAFHARAVEIAEAWRAGESTRPGWRDGYVPLQEPTVLPADPRFTEATRQAFEAGWYRTRIALPDRTPGPGTVTFPDGRLTVPLISALGAYQQLDRGGPDSCPKPPVTPPPVTAAPNNVAPRDQPGTATGGPDRPVVPGRQVTPDPDAAVSAPVRGCAVLTVTAAELGAVKVRTSRGEATVPAWLFTIAELAAPVARLAVAAERVGPVPDGVAPTRPVSPGFVGAVDLTSVTGATVRYRVGTGACDRIVEPLAQEHPDVVILGAGITPATGICTEQLVLTPVTITLDAPLGDRPVLDAATGTPLRLVPAP